ncbi:MAG: hypothetical protein J5501_07730 [Ruminococcus sp.]|nr:hypothetical protein [Ruminococcus sp.]
MTKKNKVISLFFLLLTAAAALGLIICQMGVWNMDLDVPMGFGGDYILDSMIVKSICEYGFRGLYFCYRLGAPGISEMIDTPFFDVNLTSQIWILSKFIHSHTKILYLIYFMTYPLSASTMYLLTGRFTKRYPLRMIAGVIYAAAPYHFFRTISHITLSNYFMVPIAVWLALIIAEEPFKGIAPERFGKAKWKTVIMYMSCLLIGLSNIYYAFFGLFCMGVALVYKGISTKKIIGLQREALSLVTLLLGVLIGLMPKIIYTSQHGKNEVAGVRAYMSCEIYALKVIQMILPPNFTRSSFLHKFIDHYASTAFNVNENCSSSLGAAAVAGFLLICVWVIYRLCAPGRTKSSEPVKRTDLLALITVAMVLYSSGGGFGAIIGYFVTPEIRCLTRCSIFIACMSICVLLTAFEAILDMKKEKGALIRKGAVWAFTAAVTAMALFVDIPVSNKHWQDGMQQREVIARNFFAEVENTLTGNEMVYELPYMPFPEVPPIENMPDYQPAVPYLYTDRLCWSYGAMKGRSEPTADLAGLPAGAELLTHLRERGFAGIYLDTAGYADQGTEAITALKDQLGTEPIVSADGAWYFFDIRGYSPDGGTE